MSTKILLGSLLLSLSLLAAITPMSSLGAAEGAAAEAAQPAPKLKGTVVNATESQLTILLAGAEGEQQVVTLSPEVVVKRNKEAITIADLTPGAAVTVKLDEAGAAVVIRVTAAEGEQKKDQAEAQ